MSAPTDPRSTGALARGKRRPRLLLSFPTTVCGRRKHSGLTYRPPENPEPLTERRYSPRRSRLCFPKAAAGCRTPKLRRTQLTTHSLVLLLIALAVPARAQLPGGAPEPQPLPHPELPAPPPVPEGVALWVWIVCGLLAAAMFGLILWLLLRARPLRPLPAANPRQQTLRALRQLSATAATLPPAETGHRVSLILRQYLQDRYRIPAPCRTTPELFAAAKTPPPLPKAAANGLFEIRPARAAAPAAPVVFAPLAELWDRLAFAPLPASTSEALALVETAIQRVEEDPA